MTAAVVVAAATVLAVLAIGALSAWTIVLFRRRLAVADALVGGLSEGQAGALTEVRRLEAALQAAGEAQADLDARLARVTAERDEARVEAATGAKVARRLVEAVDTERTDRVSAVAARDAEYAATLTCLLTVFAAAPRALGFRARMPEPLPGGDWLVSDGDGPGLILTDGDDLVGAVLPAGTTGTGKS